MSDPDPTDPDLDVVQAPDELPARPIAVTAGVVGLAMAASVVVVLLMARCGGATVRLAGPVYSDRGLPDQINAVAAELYGQPTLGERDREAARTRLESWGWSDRARRRVHVPTDVAVDRLGAPSAPPGGRR